MVFSNSVNASQAGVQSISSTGAWTGSSVNQFSILVGGPSNSISNIAPSATSGVPLISQGVSSAPIFGAITVDGGGTGATSFTPFTPVVAGSTPTDALSSIVNSANSGIPLISQAGASPVFGTASVTGGGTGKMSFLAYSVICAGVTAEGALENVSGLGTSGQILTSNGAATLPTWKANLSVVGDNATGVIVNTSAGVATVSTNFAKTNPIPGSGDVTFINAQTGVTFLTYNGATGVVSLSNALGVVSGGTGVELFTPYSVICGGTTATGVLQNVSGLGTAGQQLTSNGAGTLPTWQSSVGNAIVTISGNTGSVTGSTVSLETVTNGGSTASFDGSGSTMTMSFWDSENNVGFGQGVFAANQAGTNGINVALGYGCLNQLNNGSINGGYNVAIGGTAGIGLISGVNNVLIGTAAGSSYNTSESANIIIGSMITGIIGESSVIRIGRQGKSGDTQDTCYIAGIATASNNASAPVVVVNTLTGKLTQAAGIMTVPADSHTATNSFGPISAGSFLRNNLGYDILVNVSVNISAAVGATLVMGVGPTTTPTTDPIIASLSVATIVSFSAIIPANYYILLNSTGTITIASITTQVCPI